MWIVPINSANVIPKAVNTSGRLLYGTLCIEFHKCLSELSSFLGVLGAWSIALDDA